MARHVTHYRTSADPRPCLTVRWTTHNYRTVAVVSGTAELWRHAAGSVKRRGRVGIHTLYSALDMVLPEHCNHIEVFQQTTDNRHIEVRAYVSHT